MSTVESSRDGVWVRKAFDADRLSSPVVVFRIESLRNDSVTVTVSDPIPTAVPTDAVKFHPEFEPDNWRATGERTVEYERRLDGGETVTTLYAAAVDPETARRNLMGDPTIAAVTPESPGSGESVSPGGHGTESTGASAGNPQGQRAEPTANPTGDSSPGGAGDRDPTSTGAQSTDEGWGTVDDAGKRGGQTGGGRRGENAGSRNAAGRGQRADGTADRDDRGRPHGAGNSRRADRRAARRRNGVGRGLADRYGTPQSLPVAGAVGGAAAFLLGFLVTYLLDGDALDGALSSGDLLFVRNPGATDGLTPEYLDGIGVDPPGTARLVAWLYHDLHAVDLGGTVSAEGGGQSVSYDVVVEYGPDAFLYVVPPLALAVGGFLVARYLGYCVEGRAAKAGASVALGYAALAGASALLLAWEASATTQEGGQAVTYAFEYGPDPVSAVLFAGLLYPVAFGAVGGYVAGATADGRP